MDALKTKEPNVIKMTESRKEAINTYIELQKKYQELYLKSLVAKFSIFSEQEEVDIDKLSDTQQASFEKANKENDTKSKEKILKSFPKIIRDYEKYLIAPFYIGDSSKRADTSISEIETSLIEMINKRTEQEIKPFLHFLSK